MKFYWAQVNSYGIAHGKYFQVNDGETLENVILRHFEPCKIIDVEEVTKEHAEKHAKKIYKLK